MVSAMKTLLALPVLALAGCGPGDGLIRVADGGLANFQCKNGANVRECYVPEFPNACKNAGGIDTKARPNGINHIAFCVGADCCFWPDGGRF